MAQIGRTLKMGMVGGGPGAFIGEVHRKAARMDGGIELVAGVFSSDPIKSREMGAEQLLDPARVYDDYKKMIKGELALPEGKRIDFVSIVTPNNTHFPIARAFLEAGFHVVCDKPMTLNMAEARELAKIVRKSKRVFALTHNYTGYPMVKLARDIVRSGELGPIRKIIVQYNQGWLSGSLETEGMKQAIWRVDPKRSGAAGCMGDIGTHAENLAEYITGQRISELCADLHAFVKGRKLDDDGNCLVHFNGGAAGLLFASQICQGDENGLKIQIYGEAKGLEWQQENPNYLIIKSGSGPDEVWHRGNDYVAVKSPAAGRGTRIPFGHPEGFIEAFANIYRNAADTMRAAIAGEKPTELELDFPTVEDGLRGMLFVETVVASAKSKEKWVKMGR